MDALESKQRNDLCRLHSKIVPFKYHSTHVNKMQRFQAWQGKVSRQVSLSPPRPIFCLQNGCQTRFLVGSHRSFDDMRSQAASLPQKVKACRMEAIFTLLGLFECVRVPKNTAERLERKVSIVRLEALQISKLVWSWETLKKPLCQKNVQTKVIKLTSSRLGRQQKWVPRAPLRPPLYHTLPFPLVLGTHFQAFLCRP